MSVSGIDLLYSLLTDHISETIIVILDISLAAFAGYRSFVLSRALPVPSYRKRALWLGVLDLGIIAFLATFVPVVAFGTQYSLLSDLVSTTVGVIFFIWIVSTINVALSQDYFHRNTLHWKEFRWPFWVGVVIASVENSYVYAVTPDPQPTPLYISSIILTGLLFGYSSAVLAVGALRTTDTTMRTHFRWISLLLLAAIAIVVVPFQLFLYEGLVFTYIFYRATRSLYPIGRIEKGPSR